MLTILYTLTNLLPERHELLFEVLHVMRAVHIVVNLSTSGGAERLYSVELVFFHSGRLAALNDRHSFSRVDPYTKQIAYIFNRACVHSK